MEPNLHIMHMRLAEIRAAKGLSQEELAELIGKHQSTVQRAEALHPSAKVATYQECADALGVTLADVFADDRSAAEGALLERLKGRPAWVLDRMHGLVDLVLSESPESQLGA